MSNLQPKQKLELDFIFAWQEQELGKFMMMSQPTNWANVTLICCLRFGTALEDTGLKNFC